jgi:hypothetical protein
MSPRGWPNLTAHSRILRHLRVGGALVGSFWDRVGSNDSSFGCDAVYELGVLPLELSWKEMMQGESSLFGWVALLVVWCCVCIGLAYLALYQPSWSFFYETDESPGVYPLKQ